MNVPAEWTGSGTSAVSWPPSPSHRMRRGPRSRVDYSRACHFLSILDATVSWFKSNTLCCEKHTKQVSHCYCSCDFSTRSNFWVGTRNMTNQHFYKQSSKPFLTHWPSVSSRMFLNVMLVCSTETRFAVDGIHSMRDSFSCIDCRRSTWEFRQSPDEPSCCIVTLP